MPKTLIVQNNFLPLHVKRLNFYAMERLNVKKGAGRPLGSESRTKYAAMRESLNQALDYARFAEELEKLEGREYVDMFLKALRFILPVPVIREGEEEMKSSVMTEFQKAIMGMAGTRAAS